MRELARADVGGSARADRLPVVNESYIRRWRKAYGVTWRTVNLRYKISAEKRKDRLRFLEQRLEAAVRT